MRAAVGVLLLLAAPLAHAQAPPEAEPVDEARASSTSHEAAPRTPAFALLLAVAAAAALALAPRRE